MSRFYSDKIQNNNTYTNKELHRNTGTPMIYEWSTIDLSMTKTNRIGWYNLDMLCRSAGA